MAGSRKNLIRREGLIRSARTRLTRLARRPRVQALARLARRRGQSLWMVGGALRDVLLGRPVAEIDVAVTGDAEGLAREMEAARWGTCVRLSDVPPRVFRVAGGGDLDVAEAVGGSMETDLARRDFTVNAIAWEFGSGRLVDPYGGVDDLATRRLRLVSAKNLLDDPLRVLRAGRLVATHRLIPDRQLTRAAGRAAPGLASVAPERVRTEILKLLEAEQTSGALRWLRSVGALAPALGLPSTSLRSRRVSQILMRLDRPRLKQTGPRSRRRLRLSLIAAGLGFSPTEAARWLISRRFSREEAGDVSALLKLAAAARESKGSRAQWAWVRDSGNRREEALRLLALLFPDLQSRIRRLAALRPASAIRIRGEDVMRWLRLPPGPDVGFFLRELEIEAIRGAVRSRRDARRWLAQNRSPASSLSPGRKPAAGEG